jgi:hypothetical protein
MRFAPDREKNLPAGGRVNGQKPAACLSHLNHGRGNRNFVLAYDAAIRTLRLASGKDRLATAGSANRV